MTQHHSVIFIHNVKYDKKDHNKRKTHSMCRVHVDAYITTEINSCYKTLNASEHLITR